VEYGVSADAITVAADMAWLLDPVSPTWGIEYLGNLGIDSKKTLVGINVNNEPFMQRTAPRFLENVARFLDGLIQNYDALPVFFCNDVNQGASADKAASELVKSSMRHAERTFLVPNDYFSPQQMFSLIACCRATVSTRYHFCLFSALQSVPFIALERSDKVKDLCWDLKWPGRMPIETAEPSTLLDMYQTSIVERSALAALLTGRAHMRERALKNHVALDALISKDACQTGG
jgi:polysaccharide pyruvyl transferase WcaK-like protein